MTQNITGTPDTSLQPPSCHAAPNQGKERLASNTARYFGLVLTTLFSGFRLPWLDTLRPHGGLCWRRLTLSGATGSVRESSTNDVAAALQAGCLSSTVLPRQSL